MIEGAERDKSEIENGGGGDDDYQLPGPLGFWEDRFYLNVPESHWMVWAEEWWLGTKKLIKEMVKNWEHAKIVKQIVSFAKSTQIFVCSYFQAISQQ